MKYLIIIEQDGEGCDYTIGCGVRVEEADADEATVDAQVAELALEYEHSEQQIARARYVPLGDLREADLQGLRGARAIAARHARQAVTELNERALYEHLRTKFGGS